MLKIPQIAPLGRKHRISSDSASVWPLRDLNGKTWAERKAQEQRK